MNRNLGRAMSEINLNSEDLANLSEDEFKKQLLQWVETHDVSKSLQSKLRKDLFDSFNSTSLGRLIAAQHQRAHRIVLSPLVLVLNTLVAEFLYTQDCHFTLSVFSTEGPYKNAMPDFEAKRKFRFNSAEMDQIFEAIHINSEIRKRAITLYDEPTHDQVNTSLLYSLFRIMLPSTDIGHSIGIQTTPISNNCMSMPTPNLPTQNDTDLKYFKKFTQYLDLLSDHLLHMTKSMKSLKGKSTKKPIIEHDCFGKFNQLNQSLEKITEKLKEMSVSKTDENHIHAMVQNVTKMTSELQRCAESFEKLLELTARTSAIPTPTVLPPEPIRSDSQPTTYPEWVRCMKTSKFGQKFIASLEAYQTKMMQQESDRLQKILDDQLAQHRLLIKLHYKQKLLEKCKCMVNAANSSERAEDLLNFNEAIDAKLKALKEREASAVSNQLNVEDFQQKNNGHLDSGSNLNKKVPPLSRHKVAIINILPQTNQFAASPIPQSAPEPYTDHIVKVAKHRLLELESEGDQLERSFHSYLQRHNERNRLLNKDAKKVWQNYEIGKKLLSTQLCPTPSSKHPTNIAPEAIYVTEVQSTESSELRFDCEIDEYFDNHFDNPYRMYDIALRTKDSSSANPEKQPNNLKTLDKNEQIVEPTLVTLDTSNVQTNRNLKTDPISISKQTTEQCAQLLDADPLSQHVMSSEAVSDVRPSRSDDIGSTDVILLPAAFALPATLNIATELNLLSSNSDRVSLNSAVASQILSEPVSMLSIRDTGANNPIQMEHSASNDSEVCEIKSASLSSIESDVHISGGKKSSSSEEFWN